MSKTMLSFYSTFIICGNGDKNRNHFLKKKIYLLYFHLFLIIILEYILYDIAKNIIEFCYIFDLGFGFTSII